MRSPSQPGGPWQAGAGGYIYIYIYIYTHYYMNKDCLICDLGGAIFVIVQKQKKMRDVRTIIFVAELRRDLCYASEKKYGVSSTYVVLLLLDPMGIKMAP